MSAKQKTSPSVFEDYQKNNPSSPNPQDLLPTGWMGVANLDNAIDDHLEFLKKGGDSYSDPYDTTISLRVRSVTAYRLKEYATLMQYDKSSLARTILEDGLERVAMKLGQAGYFDKIAKDALDADEAAKKKESKKRKH